MRPAALAWGLLPFLLASPLAAGGEDGLRNARFEEGAPGAPPAG